MDLLGSILKAMDKPPTVNEEQKRIMKRQKEMTEELQKIHNDELSRFRKYVEERIERFAKDDRLHIEFQPLDKVHRGIIHDVAEYGGFICKTFGCDDMDRYSVVYKKENGPTEDEIAARRNGDGWNEEIAKEYAERRGKQKKLEIERRLARAAETSASSASSSATAAPTSIARTTGKTKRRARAEIKPAFNYKDKYAHIIGKDAALEAARKTETNASYGFVPSKNKKDVRSIEQTLADIQAKKRLKLQQRLQEEQQQQDNGDKSQQSTSSRAAPSASR